MKKIVAYETDDGTVFKDREKAMLHNTELRAAKLFGDFVHNAECSTIESLVKRILDSRGEVIQCLMGKEKV